MRVPLIILTGFLGSGKTTLLNRLLARRAARGARGKLGVIVNELGEVGIDGALLAEGAQGAGDAARQVRQVELPGGCVCCILGDDLERTLVELVTANPGLEAIVLETTGVAEPIPITWAAERAPADAHVRVAAVVTLVDATNFRASRAVSPAVDAQVAFADVALVTKAELAGEAETARAVSEVRTLAPRALVWVRGTDEHAAWLEDVLADPVIERVPDRVIDGAPRPNGEGAGAVSGRGPAHDHAHGPDHPDGEHTDACRHAEQPAAHGIDSVWVRAPGVIDLEELEDQLAALPANYVRIKGIVRTIDGRDGAAGEAAPRWTAVHRVGLRVSAEPIAAPQIEEPCIVALGPGVQSDALARCVAAAAM